MRFQVLGPLEVILDDEELDVGRGRQLALLALLLVHRGDLVSFDRLIDELWGESPPPSAAKLLQGYVSQLRRVLPPETIVTRGSGYLLAVEDTDAQSFERLVREAAGQEPAQAAQTLRTALALWRGRAFADVEYEPWAQAEIGRLEELRLVALEERVDADLQLGEAARLVPELEALVSEHPVRERLRAQLMLALYRSGRQADALDVFAAGRNTLVDELGIEPGPELRDLQRRILAQDPALRTPPRLQPLATITRRPRRLVVVGAVILATAVTAGSWEIARGRSSETPSVGGASVAVLDSRSGRLAGRISLPQTPTSLTVGAGSLWALSAADKTITEIDPRTRRTRARFTTVGVPTDLAVGAGALWVLNGSGSGVGNLVSQVVPSGVSRLDLRSGVATGAISLPTGSRPITFERKPGVGAIAAGRGAVWAIDASGAVDRIDPAKRVVVASVTGLDAQAIAASGDNVWIDDGERTVARIDPRSNRITTRIPLDVSGLDGIAVGAGAIWVADGRDGTVWRIDPGPPVVARTIPVGIGVLSLSFGNDALWAANPLQSTVSRIDPATNDVHTVDVRGTPQVSAVGHGAAWVSVNPVAAGPRVNGVQSLPSRQCGPVVTGRGRAQMLIASDLDLRGSASATIPMTRAIEFVLQQHDFRAGKYTVGYQSCDDSTAQSGSYDFAACGANAQAYAADPDLIGVIGPFNSGCAVAELPVMSRTASGPLAMLSMQTTSPDLTHRARGFTPGLLQLLYPTGQRNFARIIAPDDVQGAADARLAQRLGLARIYVLDDESYYGRDLTGGFLDAARKLRLNVAGTSTWSQNAGDYTRLVERIRRSGATGVFLAGTLAPGTGRLVRELRSGLGPRTTLIAGDGFLTIPMLSKVVGPAAVGMYVSFAGRPDQSLSALGRRFVHAFGATQATTRVPSYAAAYGAAAAEVMLDAIGRSDGTRASVTKQLFASRIRRGILGRFSFTADGDMTPTPVTIFRIVGGKRASTTYLPDFEGSVVDRVVDVPAGLAR